MSRPEAPSDLQPQRVEIAGGPAAYVEEGSGPTVVLVHGLPGSTRDYRWLAPALSPSFRTIRIDMPGFGGTPVETAPGTSLRARAAFVAAMLEALELEDVLLVGHSMGGPVVAATVAAHPERIAGAVLLCSVSTVPHKMFRENSSLRLAPILIPIGPLRQRMLPGIRKNFERAGFKGHGDLALTHTLRCVGRFSFGAHRANLAAMQRPTLVAWAADDPFIEDAIAERLYWAAPAGPRIRFPRGGHNIQATQATELADALVAWAPQVLPGRED